MNISGWVRQNRYRAKRFNLPASITVHEVEEIVEATQSKCVFCSELAASLDHLFPLANGGPVVAANVIIICSDCRIAKGPLDIVEMFNKGKLGRTRYVNIIKNALTRPGGDKVRELLQLATGINWSDTAHPQ